LKLREMCSAGHTYISAQLVLHCIWQGGRLTAEVFLAGNYVKRNGRYVLRTGAEMLESQSSETALPTQGKMAVCSVTSVQLHCASSVAYIDTRALQCERIPLHLLPHFE
jgi:hypothetical protein